MSALAGFAGTLANLTGDPAGGGPISSAAGSAADFMLQHTSTWVLDSTEGALKEVAGVISAGTAPNLNSTWFSSTYWRVAALAAMLTIPFLCAAAVQAVARADLSLLARAAFGYLPLSVLGVSLAAPLTMLLLAATDQMSAAVSASAAEGGARFLDHAAQVAGGIALAPGGSPFFAVFIGLLIVMAAVALAVELLVRAAAVYVVVLMLPLAFAALVWPARRIWAARLVELLVSLILSKFAIVAVLSLAAGAFIGGTPGISELLVAMALLMLATFAPWVLMRILPFTELAAGAAGILRSELGPRGQGTFTQAAIGTGDTGAALMARLRDQSGMVYAGRGGEQDPVMPGSSQQAAKPEPRGPQPVEPEPAGQEPGGSPGAEPPAAEPLGAEPPAAEPPAAAAPAAEPDAAGAPAHQPRQPFVLPADWRGTGPVRLDEALTLPPAQPPQRQEETDES